MAGKSSLNVKKIVEEQDHLNATCFRILRAVLHNEIKRLPEDWPQQINNEDVSVQLEYIRYVQSTLCNFNLFESILHHAARVKSPVTMELFAFLKVLLFNSSTNVQEKIYKFFITSVTETFFFSIKEYLSIFEIDLKNLRRNINTEIKNKIKEDTQFRVRRHTLSAMDLSEYYNCKDYFIASENEKLALLNNRKPIKFDSIIENGFGILLMQVLQSLCEGQFKKLQDYMRVQEDNPKSFNLVFRTCSMMSSIYSNINGLSIGIVTHVLGALNQMSIGNQENRVTLVNGKIIDYLNFILRTTEFNGASPKQVLDLRDIVVKLLINLTEENSPAAYCLAKEIMDTIDKKAISNIMLQHYQLSKKDTIPNLESLTTFVTEIPKKDGIFHSITNSLFNSPALKAAKLRKYLPIKERIFDIGYKYASLLFRFTDLDSMWLPSLSEGDMTVQHKIALKGYRKAGSSIEIIKDDCIQKVHFRIKNKKIIREDLVEKIKFDVDRSSNASKLRDFTIWADSVIEDLEHSKRSNQIKTFLIQSWYLWNYLPIILSLVINVMMLITFQSAYSLSMNNTYSKELTNPYPHMSSSPDLSIHMIYLAALHTVVCFILLITYALIAKPGFQNLTQLANSMQQFLRTNAISNCIRKQKEKDKIKLEDQKFSMLNEFDQRTALLECQKSRESENYSAFQLNGDQKLSEEEYSPSRTKNKLQSNIFGIKTFYYIIFFLSSLCGTIFGALLCKLFGRNEYLVAYYIFSFHLINIALVVTDLTGVFQAVRQSLPSMAWVGLLILIIVYYFSIVVFVLFRDSASMNKNLFCDSLGHCYFTLIRFGFLFDKWFEVFVPQFNQRKTFNYYIFNAIVTILLFIIVAIIMQNIISGIIVDKFASTRDLKDSKQEDMTNYCFICGRSSYEFETKAKGFNYHITKDHNMWSYLYYLISLQNDKISEFTSIQWHVHKMYRKKDLDFYPLGRAICLSQLIEVTEDQKLKETNDMLITIIDEIETMRLHREELQRKRKQDNWKKEVLANIDMPDRPDLQEAATIFRSQKSQSIDPKLFDPSFMDYPIHEIQFCPSTNINSIPVNLISFDPKDLLKDDQNEDGN